MITTTWKSRTRFRLERLSHATCVQRSGVNCLSMRLNLPLNDCSSKWLHLYWKELMRRDIQSPNSKPSALQTRMSRMN